MSTATYRKRRSELEHYFDRTAVEAWKRLTTDAPIGRIRATVRAGRDRMRNTLMSWLPADLGERRLLDAGCGTGALSVDAARRGANVTAVDLSAKLVDLAIIRAEDLATPQTIEFRIGDMLDPALGQFDYVVAMDSLIHYETSDFVDALAGLAVRCSKSMLFTFAPRTPALATMHMVGRLFPKSDRAPAIEPIAEARLAGMLAADPRFEDWQVAHITRVSSGFYTSQAVELRRK